MVGTAEEARSRSLVIGIAIEPEDAVGNGRGSDGGSISKARPASSWKEGRRAPALSLKKAGVAAERSKSGHLAPQVAT